MLDDGIYRPETAQLAAQAAHNRQGRGEALDAGMATAVQGRLDEAAASAEATYRWLLGDAPGEPGLSRELARMVLPLSSYTQWYWKIDLHTCCTSSLFGPTPCPVRDSGLCRAQATSSRDGCR